MDFYKIDPLRTSSLILLNYDTNLSNSTGSPRLLNLICLKHSQGWLLYTLLFHTLFLDHVNDLHFFTSNIYSYADDYRPRKYPVYLPTACKVPIKLVFSLYSPRWPRMEQFYANFPCLGHRRTVADIYTLNIYFLRLCLDQFATIFPPLITPLVQTRSSNNSHNLTVTLDKHRTSCSGVLLCPEHLYSEICCRRMPNIFII